MNPTQELFQLADSAAGARSRLQEQAIREPLRVLRQICDEVGRAWSGSNIGYHATVYYSNFQPKPPYVQFSAEWGLMDVWPTHQPDPGWLMMDYKDVNDYIVSRVGHDEIQKAGNALGPIQDDFANLKENAISILSALLSTTPDSFLQRQFNAIEQLTVRHPQEIARQFIEGGQVFSRDTTAMTQGFCVAPHQSLSALPLSSMELEAALDKLEKATRLSAAHVARLEERQPTMTTNTGTTICIGHGRSSLWRELKEFLVERLHLTVDEFNSIPTAGISTTERLREMLDAAAFAFLIMTGEDEQADGKVYARLNVVHEAGLFQGRLGFRKAIILLEDGCEEFSNVHGLGQIRFQKGNISAKFEEIRRVLERERVILAGSRPEY
jgi:predicted nucleotide-binding protein